MTTDPMREALARAAFDPGHFAGERGDRTLPQWIADACLAVIQAHHATLKAERDAARADRDRINAKLGELCTAVREDLPPVEGILADATAWKARALAAEATLATTKADHEAQASRAEERIARVLAELKRLYTAYVSLLETGRDRIIAQGGKCDPVDLMEAGSPPLISARAVIAETLNALQQESPDAR